MKDIHITTNKDGIHVEKPTSANDIIDYIKQYGFFLILGFVIIVFLLLLKRAKKLEFNTKPPSGTLGGFCPISNRGILLNKFNFYFFRYMIKTIILLSFQIKSTCIFIYCFCDLINGYVFIELISFNTSRIILGCVITSS